jgi:hypothetical protein
LSQRPRFERQTLRGQAELLRVWNGSGHGVKVGALTYRVLGMLAVAVAIALALLFLALERHGTDSSGLAFGGYVVMSVFGFVGWLYVTRTWMLVDPVGITIANPLNSAFVPWSAVQRVEGAGVSMRIWTSTWSVGVFGVQKANREHSGESIAEQIAASLRAQAASRGRVDPSIPPPSKRWGVPVRSSLVLVGLILAAGVYLFAF